MLDKGHLTSFLFEGADLPEECKLSVTALSTKIIKGMQFRLRDSSVAVGIAALEALISILIWGRMPAEDKEDLYDSLLKSITDQSSKEYHMKGLAMIERVLGKLNALGNECG
jgi:hypothetical protein